MFTETVRLWIFILPGADKRRKRVFFCFITSPSLSVSRLRDRYGEVRGVEVRREGCAASVVSSVKHVTVLQFDLKTHTQLFETIPEKLSSVCKIISGDLSGRCVHQNFPLS